MNPKNNFINSLSNKISNFSVGVKKPVTQTPVQTSPYQIGVSATRPGVTAPAKAMITSNPSATSANKTVIKAPTTNSSGSALSSAGKQFANTLSANDASNKYNTATGELNTNYSGYTAPDNKTNNTATSTQPAQQEDPYIKYLNSLFNPEQTTKALDTLNSANTRLADIQNRNEKQALDARVNYENTLDTPGGLKIGAEQAASVGNRRASAESAYGAIEEGAAARSAMVAKDTYDQYINAGKTVYEATQAANKAKKEEERYASETTYSRSQDAIKNKAAEDKFNEDKRQYGLDYALKQKELAISQQKANQSDPNVVTAAPGKGLDQINLIKSSLSNAEKLSHASGRSSARRKIGDVFVGANDYTNLVAETNTLRTNFLTLMTDPTIKKFFGPQMSNADVQLMTSAGTTLNPELQTPASLQSELVRMKDLVNRAEKAVNNGQNQASSMPVYPGYTYNPKTGNYDQN